jgi:hypothetical protein
MSVVETVRFRLVPGADAEAFLEADRRVQVEVVPTRAGFLRRTTARGEGGEWLVVSLWQSIADADAALEETEDHPAMREFLSLVEAPSFERRCYETLD